MGVMVRNRKLFCIKSDRKCSYDKKIRFINENTIDFIKKLRSENRKDICICGRAGLIQQSINENCIDEY